MIDDDEIDDEDGSPWRKATPRDVNRLVDEWTGIALTSVLDSHPWTPAERAEIVSRGTPLLRAFYFGHFSAMLGPPAHTDHRLH